MAQKPYIFLIKLNHAKFLWEKSCKINWWNLKAGGKVGIFLEFAKSTWSSCVSQSFVRLWDTIFLMHEFPRLLYRLLIEYRFISHYYLNRFPGKYTHVTYQDSKNQAYQASIISLFSVAHYFGKYYWVTELTQPNLNSCGKRSLCQQCVLLDSWCGERKSIVLRVSHVNWGLWVEKEVTKGRFKCWWPFVMGWIAFSRTHIEC